ncbi:MULTISPECIES: hypothetical protein [unclassified Niallia]|uniref:SF0329 family protein n=2 Tax=Niallia TaxID=2837506 RepID=UPI001EDC0898|nr:MULTISPECIES: hypothetical protein [unclassified Niallia]MDL0434951.1 hypothetical protein [Niallia sp. SS-2023]UPO88759.1 hypothetical protein L8T27_006230 [Niallia sp. Man26]
MFAPKWSKVKKHLQSFISPSLINRVDFLIINYRKVHDNLGRAVITVDKKEVWNMCTITAERKKLENVRTSVNVYYLDGFVKTTARGDFAHKRMKEESFAQADFFDGLQQYFSTQIHVSLQSSNMLIKILALLDRRVGKRTLIRLFDTIQTESELVQFFYKLRCEACGINVYK